MNQSIVTHNEFVGKIQYVKELLFISIFNFQLSTFNFQFFNHVNPLILKIMVQTFFIRGSSPLD